jgi:hypothetical protein
MQKETTGLAGFFGLLNFSASKRWSFGGSCGLEAIYAGAFAVASKP